MWFSYLLVFLHKVLGLDTYLCGIIILVGQIADGIATPLVGLESDYWASRPHANPIRSRKFWHLAGSICVAATFPFLFMKCIICSDNVSPITFLIFYVSVFVYVIVLPLIKLHAVFPFCDKDLRLKQKILLFLCMWCLLASAF